MQNRRSARSADRINQATAVPWSWLERNAAAAFTTAGVLLLASAVVPIGLKTVTGWAWVSGLVLVGLGFLAGAIGLFGLYPTLGAQDSRLAALGVLGGGVAAVAALGLITLAAVALVGEVGLGMDLGKPIGIFAVASLSMAGGYGVGGLSAGTAGLRSGRVSRSVSALLLAGGAVVLVPVVGEVLRRGFGIETGLPSWVFIPALGLLMVVSVAIGFGLRSQA